MRRNPRSRVLTLVASAALVAVGCAPDGEAADLDGDPVPSVEDTDNENDDGEDDDEQPDDDDEQSDEQSDESDEMDDPEPTTTVADTTITTTPPDESGASTVPTTTTTAPATTTAPGTTTPAATTPAPTTAAPTTAPPTAAPTTVPQSTTPPDDGATPAAALAGLNGLLAEIETVDGIAELDLCSLDPTGNQIDAVLGSLETGPFADAFWAVTEALVADIGDEYGSMLTCERFDGTFETGVGMSAIAAPADLVAFTTFFANPEGIDGIEISVDEAGTGSGGTFYRVCAVDTVDPAFSYCEVDWIADGLMVTAWLAGASAPDADLASVQAALAARLPFILTNLTNPL